MSDHELTTMWTISTGHLPRGVRASGLECLDSVIAHPWGEWGWIMYVPSHVELIERSGYRAIDTIIAEAFACGYQWVKFDSDGPRVDNLPWFD